MLLLTSSDSTTLLLSL